MKFELVRDFGVGNLLVKPFVFIFLHFSPFAIPNCLQRIQLLAVQFDGVWDELRKFCDDLLNFRLLRKLSGICSKLYDNFGTSFKVKICSVRDHKFSASIWNPTYAIHSICFGEHLYSISNNKRRVESNSELSNDWCQSLLVVVRFLQCFHKLFGAWFRNRAEVCDRVLFWHSDAWVVEGDCSLFIVRCHLDPQINRRLLGFSFQFSKPLFFKSIWAIW